MLCSIAECTGCLACINVCKKHAISIEKDNLGKTYPCINLQKCVECKACQHVCPVLNLPSKRIPSNVYAAWSTNSIDIAKSSSGGIATRIGKNIINSGGSVCGAAVVNGEVQHIIVDTIDDLEKLRGSKYVQSNPKNSYKVIKELLKTGRKIAFIGTPCQTAAMKNYVNDEIDNLLLIDLICHGVPPQEYLKEYLSQVSTEYDNFSFRGINDGCLTTYLNESVVYKQSRFKDLYYQAFEDGLIFRDNCYQCPYATRERVSDLTIGDFWGLDRTTLEHSYDGKISVILVCTPKGKKIIEELENEGLILEERTLEEAANKAQTNLNRPSLAPKDRVLFEQKYKKYGFIKAVKSTGVGKIVYVRRLKGNIMHHIIRKGE